MIIPRNYKLECLRRDAAAAAAAVTAIIRPRLLRVVQRVSIELAVSRALTVRADTY